MAVSPRACKESGSQPEAELRDLPIEEGELRQRYPPELSVIVVGPAANVRQAPNPMRTYGVSQIPVIDGRDCVASLPGRPGDSAVAPVRVDGSAAGFVRRAPSG